MDRDDYGLLPVGKGHAACGFRMVCAAGDAGAGALDAFLAGAAFLAGLAVFFAGFLAATHAGSSTVISRFRESGPL